MLTTDHGLVAADGKSRIHLPHEHLAIFAVLGEDHKRQRKVMLPAFGTPESKALFPIFSRYAESVSKLFCSATFRLVADIDIGIRT